jgi:cytochrome c-type biogenesis protein CcmF
MGNVYNPSTENFWNRDIYTYISYAEENPGMIPLFESKEIQTKDTVRMNFSLLILDSVSVKPRVTTKNKNDIDPGNVTLSAHLRLLDMRMGRIIQTTASYIIQNNEVTHADGKIPEAGYRFTFDKVSENPGKIVISAYEDKMDYIVVKAVINPYINLIWFGTGITFLGLIFSLRKRMRLSK